MSHFRSADGPRPSSSSKAAQKLTGNSSISEVFDFANRGHRKSGSFSSRRLSEASARRPDDVGPDSHHNRWSSSTASSTGLGHRKNGSFSKRFSFGAAAALNPGFRSMSPTKRRRPSDAVLDSPSNPVNHINHTNDNSQNSLPSIDRFSPLTLPTISSDQDPATQRSPPPLASPPSATRPSRPGYRDANGPESPQQRRVRDPSQKAGTHLADIMETSAGTSSSAAPRAPTPGAGGRPQSRRAASRGVASRDPSPTKASSSQSAEQASNPPVRRRSKRDKDKKAMLSKALKRANEAVQLDNVQDYYQAVAAYEEACDLLDSVLSRTSAEVDKQKLASIRETYFTRINELRAITGSGAAAAHAASDSQSSGPTIRESLDNALSDDNGAVLETATAASVANPDATRAGAQEPRAYGGQLSPQTYQAPSRNQAFDAQRGGYAHGTATANVQGRTVYSPVLTPPIEKPAPLSPRLRTVPLVEDVPTPVTATMPTSHQRESGVVGPQRKRNTRDAGSWFIAGPDEVPSNPSSAHHSVDSYDGLRRRDISGLPNDTEAEFDAALEAAIESAYDDGGFAPYNAGDYSVGLEMRDPAPLGTGDPINDQARSYAIRQAKIQRLSQRSRSQIDPDLAIADFSDGGSGIDSDEEDRLLAAGRDIAPEDPRPAESKSKPSLPRQSDSSNYTTQTWASSTASSVNTGATSLMTVDENPSVPSVALPGQDARSSLSPPKRPPIPRTADSSPSREVRQNVLGESSRGESPLRDRRSSAHNKAKNLRIETKAPSERRSPAAEQAHLRPSEPFLLAPTPVTDVRGDAGSLTCPYPSPNVAVFQNASRTPTTPTFAKPFNGESAGTSPTGPLPRSTLKPERPLLKHNASSLSLSKQAQLGLRTPEEAEPSPDTPMSFAFSNVLTPPERQDSRLGQPMSTPMDATFGSLQPVTSAKMKIFDHEIHSATLPGSPNPDIQNGPRALEPCPESVLLRPFWLMRCIHQTLTHPKGGYITTKVFIPHDVWKVKSAKLKGVEEKIANCDLLTAGLMKLSAVNTNEAEAVLDEMNSFELVLDQAQSNLSRRLGSEVGVQGVSALFKEAPSATSPTTGDPNATESGNQGNTTSTGSRTSSKSYLNSWRKLRNKSSTNNMSSAYASKEGPRESTTMASVPMTSNNDVQTRSRNKQNPLPATRADSALLDGPNANYAGALARLCDAAQILDQIARQAEDPGLKFTNQTHVGIELSARHAAEFFSFYICRFVLQDLSMLTEKFVKRATEWVMA